MNHTSRYLLRLLIVWKLKVAPNAESRHELDKVILIPHLLYSGKNGATETGWGFLWVILFGVVAAGVAGYAVYKYRIRVRHERISSVDISMFIIFC